MRKEIKKTVYKILENEPETRKDDYLLILRVVQVLKPYSPSNTFIDVMYGMRNSGISFESITRARRKFFEERPELKDKKITEIREKEEEEYFLEYSNHIPFI